MSSGKNILEGFRKKWQLMQVLQVLLYAIGPAFLLYFLSSNAVLAILVLIGILLLGIAIKKPWQLSLEKVGHHIDNNLDTVEYSTGLILLPDNQLSNLAKLQRYHVYETLEKNIVKVKPKVSLKEPALIFCVFALMTFLAHQFNWASNFDKPSNNSQVEDKILFNPLDSTQVKKEVPVLENQELRIQYPSYTGIGTVTTSNMNVKALEGSKLSWQLEFDSPIQRVIVETNNEKHPMMESEKGYGYRMSLNNAGFYNFRFWSKDGASYQSELYALEMFKDESPEVKILSLNPFVTFNFDDEKKLEFDALVSDDYGISDAYIIATVSKGEGESVKFREERLQFASTLNGTKNQKLSKRIDLDAMGMEPGDELYFYIGVTDNKVPKPNTTRSETYFAVIRDTVSNRFAVEGTMGADLMPDYFRSQRQLIIDTEKLIASKPEVSKEDFNFTSNELGFDQKALRLKYGEFMGDEADSGIQVTEEVEVEQESDGSENDENEENPLAEYTHDHDDSNEHNLVDHDHEQEEGEEKEKDPLENYLHNHDDPEESTLFTQSLKSKLRQAMTEMWDAELYLRLYTPEKSLPYQYRALKLIQEIKNSARIYVHRIGFDPPPIKEDKRLSGELDEVVSFQKKEDLGIPEVYPFLKMTAERLPQLIQGQSLEEEDKNLFSKAGQELAELAIREPGKYLKTLQKLKWISDSDNVVPINDLKMVLEGLLRAIPKSKSKPKKQRGANSELNELFLKELEIND